MKIGKSVGSSVEDEYRCGGVAGDLLDGIGLGGDGAGPRKAEAEAKSAMAEMIMSASDDRALMWGKEEREGSHGPRLFACTCNTTSTTTQLKTTRTAHAVSSFYFSFSSLLFLFLSSSLSQPSSPVSQS